MITVKTDEALGRVKPMHATNNGPVLFGSVDNSQLFMEAGIPYARIHDSAFFDGYGGEHGTDITGIFPNFDADPYDEKSYDFACTDKYLTAIKEAGMEIFYRLGSKIEHTVKKYGTLPPKDFHKWAVICEHIIRHYNEGWADGYHMDIKYWEIWNEPDLEKSAGKLSATWGGTAEQFYELYAITATHLKSSFPDLKIGGPAMASPKSNRKWMENFLEYLTREGKRVPLDFFSWHRYDWEPANLPERSVMVRELLDQYGYRDAKSILNEWNYICEEDSWKGGLRKSFKYVIKAAKGAVFDASVMCKCQNSDIDMLMYYDARPTNWNGLFDIDTFKPLKSFYAFKLFNDLYKKGTQVAATSDVDGIDVLAARDEAGNVSVMLVYYTDKEDKAAKRFGVSIKRPENRKLNMYLLDEEHDAALTEEIYMDTFELSMKPNSVVFISTDY